MSTNSVDQNILALEDLSVLQGRQFILKDVKLNVLRGEIHAILGPPGSGKSTLIRAIAGVVPSTRGRIIFEAHELKKHSPRRAMDLGIEAVLNESTLYPTLSLCENISISRVPRRKLLLYDMDALHRAVNTVIQELSFTLNPDRPLMFSNNVEQYLAQFVKAICYQPKLLLIDEISMKLPPPELEKVKHFLAMIRQRGTTIIYSTNNMEEIFNFASRVSILKNGRIVATSPLEDIDKIQLVQMTYSFLSSREKLERSNFELFYLKNFYESIFNSIPAPIMVTDTKGAAVVINSKLKELLDFEEGIPSQSTFTRILSLSEEASQETWKVIKSGNVARLKVPARGGMQDSEQHTISAFALSDEDDAFTGVMFIALTAMESGAKALLPEVSELQMRTDKLMAKVAHEIRNPLGIILNYLKLIGSEESIERIRDKARTVENEVRRIKHITEDILSQSMRMRAKKESLQAIINDVIRLVRPTADSSNIEITSHLQMDYVLIIDAELFKQVILNIMINAVEAMPNGGRLEMREGFVTSSGKNYLEISLTDTGIGIPAEQIPSIFDAFFTTKERKTNQGLGLSISRDIMTQLSGSITVESTINKGSTFRVSLPRELIIDYHPLKQTLA